MPHSPRKSNRERFHAFHQAHPEIAQELAELAHDLKGRGAQQWSIAALFAVLRHNRLLLTGKATPLQNNFMPYYSRLLMERHPDLVGFFKTRRQWVD